MKILFVGEARPAKGTFFYFGNSNLYKYTKEAFEKANISFSLEKFKEIGCWLYDVCDEPILNSEYSKKQIIKGLPKHEDIINELKPIYIIVLKKGDMKKIVYSKVRELGYSNYITAFNTPFPSNGWQLEYKEQLSQILNKIIK